MGTETWQDHAGRLRKRAVFIRRENVPPPGCSGLRRERVEFTHPCPRGAAVAATNDRFGGSDVQPP